MVSRTRVGTVVRRGLTALAVSATVAALAGTSAATARGEKPAPKDTTSASISGWARMYFPAPGNDVRVSVDAHATFTGPSIPERSSGTFRIYHRVERQGKEPLVNWGVFEVDCLTTGGPTATVTGTLKRAAPDSPWQVGVRTGVSFYVPEHGGPARIGLAGMPEEPLTRCMAPAADARVIRGGYTLEDKTPVHSAD